MSLAYNRFEFLEFFDNERIVDPEVETVRYSISIDEVFIFELYISPYDGYASITLNYNKWEKFIFNIDIRNSGEIKLDKQKKDYAFLGFYRDESINSILIVPLKPTISLSYSINELSDPEL